MVKVSGPVPSQNVLALERQMRRAPVQTIFRIDPDSVPPVSNEVPEAGVWTVGAGLTLNREKTMSRTGLLMMRVRASERKINEVICNLKFLIFNEFSSLKFFMIKIDQKTREEMPKANRPDLLLVNKRTI